MTAVPSSVVCSADALAARLMSWMGDAPLRRAVWTQQRAALPDAAAVAERYVAAVAPWLQACRTTASARSSS